MSEKVLKILVTALLREFMCESVDELLILCTRKGIRITMQLASDIYYNYTWSKRKQLPYTPLENNRIVVPATDVKQRETNKLC